MTLYDDHLIIFLILFGSVAIPLGVWHLITKNLPKELAFKQEEAPLNLLFEIGTLAFSAANVGWLWITITRVKKVQIHTVEAKG